MYVTPQYPPVGFASPLFSTGGLIDLSLLLLFIDFSLFYTELPQYCCKEDPPLRQHSFLHGT